MSNALYRKYRPKSFSELIGQNHIKVTLQNEIETGRIAHAYLFSGPRGIGKTTTARLFAKALNCANPKGSEPCNKCDFCREVSEGRSLDLIEIDAASYTGVDNVRENIIENTRFTPARAKYKIFVIDEVHMLSISAFNALLKTLEEPPSHVIFILATTEIHKVPATIISRCQRFDFRRVSVPDLVKRLQYIVKLEDIKIDQKILEMIARKADGSVRDAEVLLSQVFAIGGKKITEAEAELVIPRSDTDLVVELVEYLIKKDLSASINFINRVVEEGINLTEFAKDLIEFLRKLMLSKIRGVTDEFAFVDIDEQTKNKVMKLSELTRATELARIIEIFLEKYKEMKYAQIVQLPLELAFLEICEQAGAGQSIVPSANKERQIHKKGTGVSENAPKKSTNQLKTASHLTLSQIAEKWPALLANLRQYNHSLALSLRMSLPAEIKNNILTIGFRHKFHAERIREIKNIVRIEEVLEDIFNQKIKVKTAVLADEDFDKLYNEHPIVFANGEQGKDIWNQVMESFGGEVVS